MFHDALVPFAERRIINMKKAFLNKNICNFIVSLFFTLIEACFSIYIAFVLKNLTDIATSQDLSNIKTLILELILFIIGFILIGVLKSRFQNRYIGKAMCNFRNQCLIGSISFYISEII